MKRASALLILGLAARHADWAAASAPAIDKTRIEAFLRYAEGYSPGVKLTIGEPVGTGSPLVFRLPVHLSSGESTLDKTYFLTADGKQILTGYSWDLSANPFAEAGQKLNGTGPSLGPKDAKVQIVVFSDFQCPYCKQFAKSLRETAKKYPADVRVVFEDYPIEQLHPWAETAAESGHCIADGNDETFWTFHDWIFEHQEEINPANLHDKLLGFAKEHNVDVSRLDNCLKLHATKAAVDSGIKEGRDLGLHQTPTFFVNGRQVPGALSDSALASVIEMELRRPSFIPPLQGKSER